MATRTVIEIDEELCDGCGLCAQGCHEGALRIIDGKARLVGESLCDGLGACVGECPRGALTTVEREVEAYDERRVIDHILPKGMATIAAHLEHLRSHGQDSWYNEAVEYLRYKGIEAPRPKAGIASTASAGACGAPSLAAAGRFTRVADNGMSGSCPGVAERAFGRTGAASPRPGAASPALPEGVASLSTGSGQASRLEHWPVQLHLVNPRAPHFAGAHLLIAADCTAFACGAFHQALLAGRKLVIACPKLDSGKEVYVDKLRALINESGVASITLAIMEVPCCGGLRRLLDEALAGATRSVPVQTVVVGIEGGSLTWV